MELETAQKIRSLIEGVYQDVHEYGDVTLNDFPRLDHGFYESVTGQFFNRGFTHLGDVENLTITRQNKNFATCIRVFTGDGGSIQGSVFHVKPGGIIRLLQFFRVIPCDLKSIDLETEFVCAVKGA